MPQYFFDVFDGHEIVRDDEGQECPSLADAAREAEEAVRELVAAAVVRHVGMDSREMRVRDVAGSVVCAVRFRDVLED